VSCLVIIQIWTEFLCGDITRKFINIMYFSLRETTLQFDSPFWAHQMSGTEFVYLFVYFWKVLEPFGTFWKKAGDLNLNLELKLNWNCNLS
jgi:hypothetical protein